MNVLMIIGAACAVVLATRIVQRPQLGVLALAALAPYDGLLVLVDVPGIVGAWKEGLVALVVIGASFVRSPGADHTGPSVRGLLPGMAPWMLPALLLVIIAGARAAVAADKAALLGFKIGYFFLLIPLALRWAPLSARDRDSVVSILMVNGVVVSLVGLWQQQVGHRALRDLGYDYNETIRFAGDSLRSFSTFNQPFAYAFFVMMVVLVAVPVALEDPRRLRNTAFLVATPLLVAGMATAVVRASLLGLIAGGVYLAIVRYRWLGHVLLVLPLAAMVILAAGFGAATISSSSLGERVTGWTTTLTEQSIDVVGAGVGSTGSAAELVDETATESFGESIDAYQPDNYFVKMLIELGPLGLWLMVHVAIAACAMCHRRWRAIGPDRLDGPLALGVGAASLAAAVAATVSSYWEIFPADLFYWLMLGVVSSLPRIEPENSISTPSRSVQEAPVFRPMPERSLPLSPVG